ncbi:MAG: hypothetical protein II837_12940 [Treponema sp.]|nr:hypothetical protein [Treponema sp.]MBQ7165868.1 hypothetical protein [Treponema sp.]
MRVVYPVIFTETKDKKDTVLAYVPDLDRSTEGYGIADAIVMAKDLIGNMIFDVPDPELPKPTKANGINPGKSPFHGDGESFVSLVDVDLDAFRTREKSKSVRRNITLPQWLDDMAADAKLNVSAITQAALKKELGIA